MIVKTVSILVMVLCLAILPGCNDDPANEMTEPEIRSMEEFRTEAEREITEENLEEELARLEEELQADIETEQ